MMLHLDHHISLDSSHGGQDMIQDLLRGHAERPAARRHLQPSSPVAEITLCKVSGANQDEVTVIGQVHINRLSGILTIPFNCQRSLCYDFLQRPIIAAVRMAMTVRREKAATEFPEPWINLLAVRLGNV